MSDNQLVHKVILSSGKVVLLRDMKIKYKNQAAQIAGKKVKGDNQIHLQGLMNDELLKLLVLSVDDKEISKTEIEDLDGLFSFLEFTQLTKAVTKISGWDEEEKDGGAGKFEMEIVTGSKHSLG